LALIGFKKGRFSRLLIPGLGLLPGNFLRHRLPQQGRRQRRGDSTETIPRKQNSRFESLQAKRRGCSLPVQLILAGPPNETKPPISRLLCLERYVWSLRVNG
jgi:hypothetical protein